MDSMLPQDDLVTLVLGTSSMLLMLASIIFFAFLFQRKLIKKQRAFREIEKLLEKQELKSAYALIEGQDQERKRIAAEIHDNVGNLMATLKIFSDLVLQKELDPEVKRLNLKINDITETVTTEIRKISHSLDAGTIQNFGFKPAIAQLREAIESSGKIELFTQIDIDGRFANTTSLHLYRIIQELITNTLKHGKASKSRLEITQLENEISIIYEDNGIGFDSNATSKSGIGLQNIKSRINYLQGELTIHSSEKGSTFIIEIPYFPHNE
ncbi:sensor histidine kinase [Algoriphagus aquimarinus]|uniref:Oxygen sensor histidine kinase NreB n=1 Tax=Algoriphagus aquimarinus TaxID=237018 RepID=A0A1I1BLS2_9BACT|nr:ATP-binding protein [Algoriphagus aquimarinus]SFB50566.1 Histidine kinase [Algoriphagus aquimarinus]